MKRLLILANLLSIPSVASAGLVSETWTTYCDGTTERVRAVFIVQATNPVAEEDWQGAVFQVTDECRWWGCSAYVWPGNVKPLGGQLYEYRFDFTPECTPGSAVRREGPLWYYELVDGSATRRQITLSCGEPPQPIIDDVECSPLPAASTTWGAIKALYR